MKKTKKGTIIPDWRSHPFVKKAFLCKTCAQRAHNKKLIICVDCKEERRRFVNNLCERCYDRRVRDNSPIIKCKGGCGKTFHELDTNGKKREKCRSCEKLGF